MPSRSTSLLIPTHAPPVSADRQAVLLQVEDVRGHMAPVIDVVSAFRLARQAHLMEDAPELLIQVTEAISALPLQLASLVESAQRLQQLLAAITLPLPPPPTSVGIDRWIADLDQLPPLSQDADCRRPSPTLSLQGLQGEFDD